MFVRTKKIKGKDYAYLVENEWTPWGSRQKVTKYLGRAHILQKKNQEISELPSGYSQAVKSAIVQELANHGFTLQGKEMINGTIKANIENAEIKDKGKNVVLAMNEGYLCEDTLKQLLDFSPEDNREKSATKLATLTLETGLKLEPEQMLKLFEEAHKCTSE
ncbi:hypothetical protein KY329_01140 [Candidatus Woesearchaeota archaeon]|nr:hypothetical protein [Candidatus Woesearchaeota archaeon]